MPRPDRVVLLDLSVNRAQKLVAKKRPAITRTGSPTYRRRTPVISAARRELYLELARREPNWTVIHCEEPGGLRPVDEIAEEVWQAASQISAADD